MAAGLAPAYMRAASAISSAGIQVISDTRSTGYSFTLARNRSQAVLQETLVPSARSIENVPSKAGCVPGERYCTSVEFQQTGPLLARSQVTKSSGDPSFPTSLARNSLPVSLRTRKGALVHFSTNSRSYRPSLMMTLRKPRASAPSVPGLILSHFLDREANQLKRGSMQMISVPFFMRSIIQCPKTLSGHVAGML